jgi:hypothetical protein
MKGSRHGRIDSPGRMIRAAFEEQQECKLAWPALIQVKPAICALELQTDVACAALAVRERMKRR